MSNFEQRDISVADIVSQVSICYISITTVLFLFPPSLPVTGSGMSKFLTYSLPLEFTLTYNYRLLRGSLWNHPDCIHFPMVRRRT